MSLLIAACALLATAFRPSVPNDAGAPGALCPDPAQPLRQLALEYNRWPAPPERFTERAWNAFQEYLQSGNPHDYHEAVFQYRRLEPRLLNSLHSQLARGILYALGPDLNYPSSEGYRHSRIANTSNADIYAARLLSQVVARDPSQWLAAAALTRMALVSPEPERMEQATAAVQQVLAADSTNLVARLAWSDLLVAQERAPEALAFLERQPSRCAAARHALAQALILTGDTARGTLVYLDALARAQPGELDRFYDDIRVMANMGQHRAYLASPPEERRAWIQAFWKRTADASARSVEALLVEKTQRSAWADAHARLHRFQISSDHWIDWIDDTAHVVPWDVRGVIYVRHGPPNDLLSAQAWDQVADPSLWAQAKIRCSDYQAWVYFTEQGTRVLLFGRDCIRSGTDWDTLPAPPCDNRSFLGRSSLASTLDKLDEEDAVPDLRDLYWLLSRYDPRYQDIAAGCQIVAAGGAYLPLGYLQEELGRENRRLLRDYVWSADALHRFAHPMRMIIAAYEFRDPQRHPEITALLWIPTADLRDSTGVTNRLHLTYTLADSLLTTLRVDDTVAVPTLSDTTGSLRSAVVWHDVPVRTGILRVVAVDPADSTRGALRTRDITVRADSSAFALSDVVLAEPGVSGLLVRGDYHISPFPSPVVQVGEKFRLFFEIYGLKPNDIFVTTVHITRNDGADLRRLLRLFTGKRDERTLSFPGMAQPDGRGVEVQDLEVSGDLIPGEYTVEVRVRIPGGLVLRRTAGLRVEESGG